MRRGKEGKGRCEADTTDSRAWLGVAPNLTTRSQAAAAALLSRFVRVDVRVQLHERKLELASYTIIENSGLHAREKRLRSCHDFD